MYNVLTKKISCTDSTAFPGLKYASGIPQARERGKGFFCFCHRNILLFLLLWTSVWLSLKFTFLFANKSSVVGEQQIGFQFSSAIQASSVSQIHENLNPIKSVRCRLCFIEDDEAHEKNEILIESMQLLIQVTSCFGKGNKWICKVLRQKSLESRGNI